MEEDLLPWAIDGINLGAEVLEIGPGFGVATRILGARAGRLTCVELDGDLARALSRGATGTNVQLVQADGVDLPFPDETFSAALCFTMLHHIPAAVQQDRLLAEVARVIRPGGIFAGTDSVTGFLFRTIHLGDTLTPVDPAELPQRLKAAGFAEISVERRTRNFRFRARRSPCR
jgi:ubiquinone/menaquinone biosynthesis C-methylase UbiE